MYLKIKENVVKGYQYLISCLSKVKVRVFRSLGFDKYIQWKSFNAIPLEQRETHNNHQYPSNNERYQFRNFRETFLDLTRSAQIRQKIFYKN